MSTWSQPAGVFLKFSSDTHTRYITIQRFACPTGVEKFQRRSVTIKDVAFLHRLPQARRLYKKEEEISLLYDAFFFYLISLQKEYTYMGTQYPSNTLSGNTFFFHSFSAAC